MIFKTLSSADLIVGTVSLLQEGKQEQGEILEQKWFLQLREEGPPSPLASSSRPTAWCRPVLVRHSIWASVLGCSLDLQISVGWISQKIWTFCSVNFTNSSRLAGSAEHRWRSWKLFSVPKWLLKHKTNVRKSYGFCHPDGDPPWPPRPSSPPAWPVFPELSHCQIRVHLLTQSDCHHLHQQGLPHILPFCLVHSAPGLHTLFSHKDLCLVEDWS